MFTLQPVRDRTISENTYTEATILFCDLESLRRVDIIVDFAGPDASVDVSTLIAGGVADL